MLLHETVNNKKKKIHVSVSAWRKNEKGDLINFYVNVKYNRVKKKNNNNNHIYCEHLVNNA